MTPLTRPFARLDRETQDRIVGGAVLVFAGVGAGLFVVFLLAALVIGTIDLVTWLGGL